MFPTEFPADAAKTIGQAILAKQFDTSLLEPAYDLQGYAEYIVFGSSAPAPRPNVMATSDVGLDDDEIARRLVVAGEDDSDDHTVRGLPIPWTKVIGILLSLIQGVLVSEETR